MIDTSSVVPIDQILSLPKTPLQGLPPLFKFVERANPSGVSVEAPGSRFYGTRRAFSEEGDPVPKLTVPQEAELKSEKGKSKLPLGVERLLKSMRVGEVCWALFDEESFGMACERRFWMRVEVTREEKYKLNFVTLDFGKQNELLAEKKKAADELLRAKSYPEAEKRYAETFNFFKCQKKSDIKALAPEQLNARVDFGLKLCRNAIRAAFRNGSFALALEVGAFAQAHLSKEDETLNQLIAETKLASGDPTASLQLNPENEEAKRVERAQNAQLGKAFVMSLQRNPQEDLRELLMKKTDLRSITRNLN